MRHPPQTPTAVFFKDRTARIASSWKDERLRRATASFLRQVVRAKYSYNFSWLGRPIIQVPQDMFALQELIWSIRPDFVVETGVAFGGSVIFYASLLELVGKGRVIGIDIEIRTHNRSAIEHHPLSHRIDLIEGSSISPQVVHAVRQKVKNARRVIVCLDSNHTHDHVLAELELYTPFIKKGGYCVVFDTGIEDLPRNMIVDRPWGLGNNPKTAVRAFLKNNKRFRIDKNVEGSLLLTAAPDGYLRCIRD